MPTPSAAASVAMRPVILRGAKLRVAEQHLLKSDGVMAKLVRKHGNCKLGTRGFQPFHALTTAIISQQLSVKAAHTIASRVAQHAARPFDAQAMLRLDPELLRGAGLSAAKVRYILELARRTQDGAINFAQIRKDNDDAAIAALTEVPGIGRWTAEMFLIFTLKRPDILALGDAGLARAVRLLYGETAEMQAVAERWRPYRSVASWYLWRHLDAE